MARCCVKFSVADDKMSAHVRCRKCRTTLISNEEKDCIITCHGAFSFDIDSVCLLEKTLVYVKDERLPQWLETLVQSVSRLSMFHISVLCYYWICVNYNFQSSWTKGKIICPSCEARLGSFDFLSGQKCQCNQFVLPPVRLTSSKVDLIK